jgi:hypothetical protein
LKRIPVISSTPSDPHRRISRVAFTTATYGINVPGTVYRMDDVPITHRPAFESPYPSDEQILSAIRDRVRELLGGNRVPAGEPLAGVVSCSQVQRYIVNGRVYPRPAEMWTAPCTSASRTARWWRTCRRRPADQHAAWW